MWTEKGTDWFEEGQRQYISSVPMTTIFFSSWITHPNIISRLTVYWIFPYDSFFFYPFNKNVEKLIPFPSYKSVPELALHFNSCYACLITFSDLYCSSTILIPGPYSTSTLILRLNLYFKSQFWKFNALFRFQSSAHLAFPMSLGIKVMS